MASCGSFQSLCHLWTDSILVFLCGGGNHSHAASAAAGPPEISSPRSKICTHSHPETQRYSLLYNLDAIVLYEHHDSDLFHTIDVHIKQNGAKNDLTVFEIHRNGFWVSVSMTTNPPSFTITPFLKTPVLLVTLTLQRAGLSARHCNKGVCVQIIVCVLSIILYSF